MNLSKKGFVFLKEFEQFRPIAYRPTPNDVWTIAWGHTSDVMEGDCCTTAHGEVWLYADVMSAEDQVNKHVKVPLTQPQFDALASIMFNVGPGIEGKRDGIVRLKNGQPSTLLRKLNAGDYSGAAAEFPKWRKSGGRVLAGLERRRGREKKIFEIGRYEP